MSYKPRKCKLQNYRTGEVISADSIGEFCRKAGLSGNDRYHITPVLDSDNRFQFKGWHIPINENKIYEIVDIYGNKYKFNNWIKFAKENRINVKKLDDLLRGKITSLNGLFLAKNPPVFKKSQVAEVTIKKDGKTITNTNQSKISRILHCSPSGINKLVHGVNGHVNGWVVDKLVIKNKNGSIL